MFTACWLVATCLGMAAYATSCSCSLTSVESDETKAHVHPLSSRPPSEAMLVDELGSQPVEKVRTRRDDAVHRPEVRALLQHLIMRPIRVELGRCAAEWILNAWDTDRIIMVALSALLYETILPRDLRAAIGIPVRTPTGEQAAAPTSEQAAVPTSEQAAVPTGEQAAVPPGQQTAVEDKSILTRFIRVAAEYAVVSQIKVPSRKASLDILRLLVYDLSPSVMHPAGVLKALEHESLILEQVMSIQSKSFWEALVQGAMILGSARGPNSLASLAVSLPGQVAVPILSRPNVCLEMALDDYLAAREILTDANAQQAEEFFARWGSVENQLGRFRGATELVFRRIQSLGTSLLRFPFTFSGRWPADGYFNAGNAEEQLRTWVYEQAMRLKWGTKWINQLLVYIDPSDDHIHGQGLIWFSAQEEAEFEAFLLDWADRLCAVKRSSADVKSRLAAALSSVDPSFLSRAKPVFAVLMAVARAYGFQPTRKPGKCWWPLLSATLSSGVWRKIDKALRFPVDGFTASIQFLNLAHLGLAG